MAKRFTLREGAYFVGGCVAAAVFLGGAAQAITDKVFRYSTPKQGFVSLDPAGFVPLTNVAADAYAIYYVYDGAISTSAAGSCFGTSVNMPHGAKIKTLTAWYQKRVRVSLFRHKAADGSASSTAIADKTFASAQTTVQEETVAITDPALQTINNRDYSYAAVICLPHTDDYLFGVRLAYTYTTAGD